MTEVEPRTRRELRRELAVASSVAAAVLAIAAVRHTPWPSALRLGLVASIYAVAIAVGLAVLQRHRRDPGRLTRDERRQMHRALRDMGRLPDDADDRWRPALRRAVIGMSFTSWLIWSAAIVVLPGTAASGPAEDGLGSPLATAVVALGVVVLVMMLAGVMSYLSRAWSGNAQKMLDQLDARAGADR